MRTKSFMTLILEADKTTLKKWMIWVYVWGLSALLWPTMDIIIVSKTNNGNTFLYALAWIWFGLFLLFGLPTSLRIYWLTHHNEIK